MPIVTTILKMESRRFSVVCDQGGDQMLNHGRFISPANFKQRGVHVPLHRVPEKVRQQKQPLFVGSPGTELEFAL